MRTTAKSGTERNEQEDSGVNSPTTCVIGYLTYSLPSHSVDYGRGKQTEHATIATFYSSSVSE